METKTRASLGEGSTYVLANGGEGVGLYNYTGTNLAKGKAYLFVAGGGAKALTFDFSGAETAISDVKGNNLNNASVFDLSGRRVSNATRGLYIMNGQKILVK